MAIRSWRIATPAPSSLRDVVDPGNRPPRCPFKERHAAPASGRFVGRLASAPPPFWEWAPQQRAASLRAMPLHAHVAAGDKVWPRGLNVGSILVSELPWAGSAQAVVSPAWLNSSLFPFLLPSCGVIKKKIWSLCPVPNITKCYSEFCEPL